jgi:hypothetical protein
MLRMNIVVDVVVAAAAAAAAVLLFTKRTVYRHGEKK